MSKEMENASRMKKKLKKVSPLFHHTPFPLFILYMKSLLKKMNVELFIMVQSVFATKIGKSALRAKNERSNATFCDF